MTATVIICTRNRSRHLRRCLHSVVEQWPGHPWLRAVYVIDNGSTDDTAAVVRDFTERETRIRYCVETRTGLSYARNRGAREATTTWLGYLDDDAQLRPGYLDRAAALVGRDVAAFGGMYYAWYEHERPRWLPATFGTKVAPRVGAGPLESGYLSGGNLWLRKTAWNTVGGFRTDLGMRGEQVLYGEDDAIQEALRAAEHVIWYAPDLAIDHLVLPHKLRVSWHLRQAYGNGKSTGRMSAARWDWLALPAALLKLGPRVVLVGFRLLARHDYYWQNALLDSTRELATALGRL